MSPRGLRAAACCAALAAVPATAEAPRNAILFIGDGMGVSTVTAARILEGQRLGGPGEEHSLSFERFDNVALVKTYTTDAQVSDSAGTMSAIVTGVKTRSGVLSVGPGLARGDCAGTAAAALPTLAEEAEAAGMRTGIVTTTTVTHATPAALYAHVSNRNWESDADLPAEHDGTCMDIARQFVEFPFGDGIDVVLGGGRGAFLPGDVADPEYPSRTAPVGTDATSWKSGLREGRGGNTSGTTRNCGRPTRTASCSACSRVPTWPGRATGMATRPASPPSPR